MSVLETLRALAAGERPFGGLLHNARLEAFGVESYGEEAIVESFRSFPAELSGDPIVVASPRHLALLDGDFSLFVDIYDENVARIWRLGSGEPQPREAGVSVTFDPDLSQARNSVFLECSDHPDLAADCAKAIEAHGYMILDRMPAYRGRAFCVRAFGDINEYAALFAVYLLDGSGERHSGFHMSGCAYRATGGGKLINDFVGQVAAAVAPWTPRIGT